MKYKDLRFDSGELLFLLMITYDDYLDLQESLQDSTNLSAEMRGEIAFQLSYADRLFRRFRAALKEVDPELLRRYEANHH